MDVQIEESWKQILSAEFEKDYFRQLTDFVRNEYRSTTVYPPGKLIFNAFNLCPFEQVKVVIIGQDPYHGPGQAHGLCFSVNDNVPFPPSLRNIFKEIQDDLGKPIPESGNLTRWAKQGVLLLNATLTVRAHQAGSHQRRAGRSLRMQPSGHWPNNGNTWCLSCGGLCTEKGSVYRPFAASGTDFRPSFSAVSSQRILRKPAFQSRQRIPAAARADPD